MGPLGQNMDGRGLSTFWVFRSLKAGFILAPLLVQPSVFAGYSSNIHQLTRPAPKLHPGWQLRLDDESGHFRRAWGQGLDLGWTGQPDELEAVCRAYIKTHRNLFPIPETDLALRYDSVAGDKTWVSFQQLHQGIPVVGASVELRFSKNRLVLVGSTLQLTVGLRTGAAPMSLQKAQKQVQKRWPGSTVVPGGGLSYLPQGPRAAELVYIFRVDNGLADPGERLYVSAITGQVIHSENLAIPVDVQIRMEREPRSPGDALVEIPLAHATVLGDEENFDTTSDGYLTVPENKASVDVQLSGPYLEIIDEALGSIPRESLPKESPIWRANEGNLAGLDTWAAFHDVHEWAQQYVSVPYLEAQENASINVEGEACNAYYKLGTGMVFFVGSEDKGCVNFARLSDVVFHEFAHGLHHALLKGGIFDESVSEGSADYVAATLSGDPIIGPGAFGPGTFVREIETDRSYPRDLVGRIHTDGLIWAGAMWDLRKQLVIDHGDEAGSAKADSLLITTLMGGPTFQDVYSELLFADDDDGDLSNGTPNFCAINAAMGAHGLGDGGLGLLDFRHTPLQDQPQDLAGYAVSITPQFVDDACIGADLDTLTLYYRVQNGPWVAAPMGEVAGEPGHFQGMIPKQPPGSDIQYDVQVWDADYNTLMSLSGGRGDLAPSFYVGPQRAIYCDDMEAETGWAASPQNGDWTRGAPEGLGGDPEAATSGTSVFGTRFGEEGESGVWPGQYHPNMRQTLTSPTFDATGYRHLRLSYQRALSVEDAAYDQARVLAQSDIVWQNVETPEGTFHTIDEGFRRHSLPVWTLDERAEAEIAFYLRSDSDVEMGGWNVDDVCIWAPTDLDERYRSSITSVRKTAQGVEIEGFAPYANPLEGISLYRHVGLGEDAPLSAVEVATLTKPEPGAAFHFLDREAPIGDEAIVYRVYAFDGRYQWPEGEERAGEVGILEPVTPTPTPTEAISTPIPSQEKTGCGGGAWVFVLLPALFRRRRTNTGR